PTPASPSTLLCRVLRTYVDQYVEERPHRGLRLATPSGRSSVPEQGSAIQRRDVLGGLIHEYRVGGVSRIGFLNPSGSPGHYFHPHKTEESQKGLVLPESLEKQVLQRAGGVDQALRG